MPCIPLGNGKTVSGWACSRGRASRAKCSCGAPSTKLCDFPLSGRKAGKTCDAKLCDGCAITIGKVTARVDPDNARLAAGIFAHASPELLAARAELIASMQPVDTVDYCPAHARIHQAADEHANGGV